MLSSESVPLSEPYYFQFPRWKLHDQKSKVHAPVVSLGDGSYIHAVMVVVICMRGRNTEVPLCNELVMKLTVVARVLV